VVAKNLLLQTPRVIENVYGVRTTSSIVAKNQNSALLIGSDDIPKTIHRLKHMISRTFGGPQTLCVLNINSILDMSKRKCFL